MLNYLSGEIYKLCKHKALYIGTGLLLALECLAFIPELWEEDVMAYRQEVLLAFFEIALFVGVFIAPIFAVMAFDDQHGNGTLKNEIVYGIPRSRIYFGKLIAGWTVGTLAAVLAAAVFLILSLLLPGQRGHAEGLLIGALISFAAHWLTWLSVYSFTFFLLMQLKSPTSAMVLVYVITLIGFPVSMVGFSEGDVAPWLRLALQLFYTAPLRSVLEGDLLLGITVNGEALGGMSTIQIAGEMVMGGLPYAFLVCLLWTVGLSLVGWLLFTRREVK